MAPSRSWHTGLCGAGGSLPKIACEQLTNSDLGASIAAPRGKCLAPLDSDTAAAAAAAAAAAVAASCLARAQSRPSCDRPSSSIGLARFLLGTSPPGPGSSRQHLRRDWDRHCHICDETGPVMGKDARPSRSISRNGTSSWPTSGTFRARTKARSVTGSVRGFVGALACVRSGACVRAWRRCGGGCAQSRSRCGRVEPIRLQTRVCAFWTNFSSQKRPSLPRHAETCRRPLYHTHTQTHTQTHTNTLHTHDRVCAHARAHTHTHSSRRD
jgi:hypothetical protein